MRTAAGWWRGGEIETGEAALRHALEQVRRPFYLLGDGEGEWQVGWGGSFIAAESGEAAGSAEGALPVAAFVPGCPAEQLGDAGFCEELGIRYPYVAGAMANGVGSVEIVEAMARAGLIGFFGAAGLPHPAIERAIDRLQESLRTPDGGTLPFGFNLIHSPSEPQLEAGTVEMYLRKGVRLVDAAAYLRLSLPLVRYRVHGIYRGPDGRIVTPNRVIGKVSRIEVARRFFEPPPEKMLRQIVESGEITEEQAELASQIPVAQEITAEADSGGHTDNQPFLALLPTMLALRDEMQARYDVPLRVGAAGGIGTPVSAAAAFAMGAAYVLTGSVNQSCVEAGTSDKVRAMLCETKQADCAMAPAADMFEMGVKVQVLKRGTMFAMRSGKLFELYRGYRSLDEIPADQREKLEREIFRAPVEQIWADTRAYFEERDPTQLAKAERDARHKMALVFRWYLGQASNWANRGVEDRVMDYQIWCGPAMGAFNDWVRGTWLEAGGERRVATLGLNVLWGAAVLTRVHALRTQGVRVPAELQQVRPERPERLKSLLN